MLALSHDNIVTFHGPTFKEDRPRDLVYNFEKLGALNQYLHNNAPQVSAGDMVSGALQIAKVNLAALYRSFQLCEVCL